MIHGFCNHLYYYICFTQTHITLLEDSCCFPLLFAHKFFLFFSIRRTFISIHITYFVKFCSFFLLPSFINVRILFRIASKFKYRDKKQTTIKAQLLSFCFFRCAFSANHSKTDIQSHNKLTLCQFTQFTIFSYLLDWWDSKTHRQNL